jgi:aerobic carbon-monoxide dehydrogenase medium subunit
MIPAPFDYYRATSVADAIAALATDPEAKLLAGGHSLLPLMKLRLAQPTTLIDIGGLRELSYIRDEGDHLAVGALTRHRDLEMSPLAREQCPLLSHVAGEVGDPQVRHRGTLGGSISHADPASDLPAAVLALGGSLVARGPAGEREISAAAFFTGFLESALRADELLIEVRVPKVPEARWSFQKFNRRAQDWAIVGVAAVRGATTGVALVNMGSTPLLASSVATAVDDGASAAEAAQLAAAEAAPQSDLNASVEYRVHLAKVLVRRALVEAGVA